MLRSEHGISHNPRPSSLSEDGLHIHWSSTLVNFVNPPFVRAKERLLKAVEEAHQHNHSIVVCAWCATTSKETKRNTSRQCDCFCAFRILQQTSLFRRKVHASISCVHVWSQCRRRAGALQRRHWKCLRISLTGVECLGVKRFKVNERRLANGDGNSITDDSTIKEITRWVGHVLQA